MGKIIPTSSQKQIWTVDPKFFRKSMSNSAGPGYPSVHGLVALSRPGATLHSRVSSPRPGMLLPWLFSLEKSQWSRWSSMRCWFGWFRSNTHCALNIEKKCNENAYNASKAAKINIFGKFFFYIHGLDIENSFQNSWFFLIAFEFWGKQ